MPRGDVVDALSPDAPPGSLLSGFWGVVPVPRGEPGDELTLVARARLADGSEQTAGAGPGPHRGAKRTARARAAGAGPAGRSSRSAWPPTSPRGRSPRPARVDPRADPPNWVCVVSDDCSSPARFAALERGARGDPRFVVSRSPRRLGFYLNFERALSLAPPRRRLRGAWPTRTTAGTPTSSRRSSARSATPSSSTATRASSTATGEVLSDTYWSQRRNNHSDISLAAGGELASPARPRCSGATLLDARCRSRRGSSTTSTTTGSGSPRWPSARSPSSTARSTTTCSTATPCSGMPRANRMPPLRERLGGCAATLRERVRLLAAAPTSSTAAALLQFATVLEHALRRPDVAAPSGARSTASSAPTARSLALGWPGARARRASSSGRPETLGAELALLLRLPVAPRGRRERPRPSTRRARLRLDALAAPRARAEARPRAAPSRAPCSVIQRRSRRSSLRPARRRARSGSTC